MDNISNASRAYYLGKELALQEKVASLKATLGALGLGAGLGTIHGMNKQTEARAEPSLFDPRTGTGFMSGLTTAAGGLGGSMLAKALGAGPLGRVAAPIVGAGIGYGLSNKDYSAPRLPFARYYGG